MSTSSRRLAARVISFATIRADTRDLSTSNQPVMVVFEDVDCDSCDLMHDTLMRDEVVNELLGSLTVVRLDARLKHP